MRLHRLRFQNILSFVDASFTCDHHLTALVGPNDAGKSNILRIIHHLTGRAPSLKLSELRSQYTKDASPVVDLSFVTEASDQYALPTILGEMELPSSPFSLSLSCRDGALTVRAGDQEREFSGHDGEQVLERLAHSHFIHSTLRPLEPSIPLNDLRNGATTAEARLFSVVGLTQDDLTNINLRNAKGSQALLEAGQRFTTMLQQAWKKQDTGLALSLFHRSEKSLLDIMVEDGPTSVTLDRRGEGLRWFLAMLVQMREQPQRDNVLCNLFLIDEPGVFLHPAGQADLQSVLNDLSENASNQVLFTTHSPFMLDWGNPHQVRIVERDKDSRASVIVDKPYHSNEALNFWEPFRRSIGLFVGDLGLLGEKNLLVEGPSDQMIIAHLARPSGKLSGWRIIPAGNETALALIAGTCRQAERTVAVLVDGDNAGAKCLTALRKYDYPDVPIHSLLEFHPSPTDDELFCIEEFLSVREYLGAVNAAYGEFPWYEPVEESNVSAALDPTKPLAKRLETFFEGRQWRDGKPHEFNKTFVSVHLASSRRAIALDDLAGKFSAIEERLSDPYGLISLGVTEFGAGAPHAWSTTFSLAVKRDVGVRRITAVADYPGGKAEFTFPPRRAALAAAAAPTPTPPPVQPEPEPQQPPEGPEPSGDNESAAPADNSSPPAHGFFRRAYDRFFNKRRPLEKSHPVPGKIADNPSHQVSEKPSPDAQDLVHDAPEPSAADHTPKAAEATEPGAIEVFDCWARKWLGPEKTFLRNGAAILRIKGSEDLERAYHITASVEYADGSSEPFSAPIGKPISAAMRFTRDTPVGAVIKGVVSQIDGHPMGFWIEIDGYGISGFVHVTEITGGFVENVSSHVRRGQRISAKYIGVNFQRIQLSVRRV